MEPHESESPPKRRLQKKSGKTLFFVVFLIALCCLGATLYFFFPEQAQNYLHFSSGSNGVTTVAPSSEQDEPLATPDNESTGPPQQPAPPASTEISGGKEPASTVQSNSPATTGASKDLQKPQDTTQEIEGSKSKDSQLCSQLADNIESFFDTLDTRPYMHGFDIGQKSSVYFPKLIQKLVDNPPVVSGETDDLFTILQNTAHFFRIIGKKNILVLKGILDREKPTFEKTLADFYELTRYPDCLEQRFNLEIAKEPLYSYAGFFLNTMGGRLYLFRRDSMSRMVVNYYAILIVEQANREGRNKYGIDISIPINSLIDDIESSSIQLKLRDTYLDNLYSLKEKYQ